MNINRYIPVPLLIWLAGCGTAPQEKHAAPIAAVPVSTVVVTSGNWPSIYEATGTVEARTSASISAKLMGYVREVKVRAGDHVREGQSLIVLDARDVDLTLRRAAAARDEVRATLPEADSGIAQAKANLDLAQVTFGRMRELYEKRSVSSQEYDEASARLKAAQAGYEMARAKRSQLDSRLEQTEQEVGSAEVMRSYTDVRAPFEGIVVARGVEPGNLAMPGASLLTLEKEGAYRLEAAVEESKLGSIRVGQVTQVEIDGLEGKLEARVGEIVPAVDAASRAYTVKIDLPSRPALRSGLFGRAQFPAGSRTVLTVPLAAISERGQLQSVFIAEGGVARIRLITTGQKFQDRCEVLSGVTANERVIVPVPVGLADGAGIEVRP